MEKMDIDKVKGWLKESKDSGFPMLRADVAYIFFDQLIEEVDRLRRQPKINAGPTGILVELNQAKGRIDSLTAQVKQLEGERDETRERYKDLLQRMYRAPSTIDNAKLESENAALTAKLKDAEARVEAQRVELDK